MKCSSANFGESKNVTPALLEAITNVCMKANQSFYGLGFVDGIIIACWESQPTQIGMIKRTVEELMSSSTNNTKKIVVGEGPTTLVFITANEKELNNILADHQSAKIRIYDMP